MPLPKEPPPPPVPYPKRATHPAPTRAAVAFEFKHLEAISAALENSQPTRTAAPSRPRAAVGPQQGQQQQQQQQQQQRQSRQTNDPGSRPGLNKLSLARPLRKAA